MLKMPAFRSRLEPSSPSLAAPQAPVFSYSASGHIVRWLSRRELAQIRAGLFPHLGPEDAQAAVEGQAESIMRGYAKRRRWWELEDRL